MPAPETSNLEQTAILWPPTGIDKYGEKIIGTPEEIDVRWVNSVMDFVDDFGTSIKVDTAIVTDRSIESGSLLYLGTLEEWYGTGSSGDSDRLMVVKSQKTVPDMRNRETYNLVGLVRYKGNAQ